MASFSCSASSVSLPMTTLSNRQLRSKNLSTYVGASFSWSSFSSVSLPMTTLSNRQLHSKNLSTKVTASISREDFPSDFIFGTAASALQMEGSPASGGKGMSIWDSFVQFPGKIANGDMPTVACNFYDLYQHDIEVMKRMGCNTFRFSIAWARIFPNGTGELSSEGVAYYNSVINNIVKAGMIPCATLYHWDLPLYLENDPNVCGWRRKAIVEHFAKYAEACFMHFGDRVKHWITLNELYSFVYRGFGVGNFAPGRCSSVSGNSSTVGGDSSTEPYIVAHNALLAHSAASKLYKLKFQKEQKGVIGYTSYNLWCEPYDNTSHEDVEAANRYLDFLSGWQTDPVILGDYPDSMKKRVGLRLPQFTEEESRDLRGSVDFLGLNYYTANFIKNDPMTIVNPKDRWYNTDIGATPYVKDVNGNLIGEQMGPSNSWIYNYPKGLSKLLAWVEKKYGKDRPNIPIYITENGVMDPNANAPLHEILHDEQRIEYMSQHLKVLSTAINEEHRNVKGYFHWAILDNFEWTDGYSFRFGLIHVDFQDESKAQRHAKASATWYANFLGSNIPLVDNNDNNSPDGGASSLMEII